MHRFFTTQKLTKQGSFRLKDPILVKRVSRVLRLKKGAAMMLFDNTGYDFEAVIESVSNEELSMRMVSKKYGQCEPIIKVNLYQAILKGNKWDFLIEKGVEMGIARFVPLLTEHCMTREVSREKMNRYRHLIISATEQCGGSRLAEITEMRSWRSVCADFVQPSEVLSLMAWEGERDTTLEDVLRERPHFQQVNFFIGPEGGFSVSEAQEAQKAGIVTISLGKRILRAETAAWALAAKILL